MKKKIIFSYVLFFFFLIISFNVYAITPRELAEYWSPVFYQQVSTEGDNSLEGRADYITKVDFDGDWDAGNNWTSAASENLNAYVYYEVKESKNYWFIYYAVYHPRDWGGLLYKPINNTKAQPKISNRERVAGDIVHENDMEAVHLVILKDNNNSYYCGDLQIIESMAHNVWYNYPVNNTIDMQFSFNADQHNEPNEGDKGVKYIDHHPVAYIEEKGHGIYLDQGTYRLIYTIEDWDVRGFDTGYGVVYKYKGNAEEPESPDDIDVGYDLLPIKELWDRKKEQKIDDETTIAKDENGRDAFYIGNNDIDDKKNRFPEAHLPWSIGNGEEYSHPIKAIKTRYNIDLSEEVCHIPRTIEILKPRLSSPDYIGPNDNPRKIDIEITAKTPRGTFNAEIPKDYFIVEIGEKLATITTIQELENKEKYILTITPPTQDTNGLYNLTVKVKHSFFNVLNTETNAICYSEASNIDVSLVIDRSGSMEGDKISNAKSAGKQFIDLMREGDQIGVVSFNADATVDFPLTSITLPNVKEKAKRAINALLASGKTSIGDGLKAGQSQLNTKGDLTHSWAIALLSDGLENMSSYVSNVLPNIPEKTDVFTIALGEDSDEALMQNIATQTGGQYYFSPVPEELQEIYNLIRGEIVGEEIIAIKSGTVNEGETKTETVQIDPTVSLSTFGINWSGSDVNLTLEDPTGTIIDPDIAAINPNISFVFGSTYKHYTITSPNPGEWQLNIEGIDIPFEGEQYTARITGQTDLTLDVYFDKDQYEIGQPITVISSLSDDLGPIIGANIEMVVQAPIEKLSSWKNLNEDTVPTKPLRHSISTLKTLYKQSITLVSSSKQSTNLPVSYLYDDGIHGDGQAHDGVYGNTYINTSTSGTYIFNLDVSGTVRTGDIFTRTTQRSIFVDEATCVGSISGTISYSGEKTGIIYIQAWQDDPLMYSNPDYLTSVSSAELYIIPNLPDNTYYLISYLDVNNNGSQDGREPSGVYGDPDPVVVSGEADVSGINITLKEATPSTDGVLKNENVYNYPNPFNPDRESTTLRFSLAKSAKVTIKLYDTSNQLVTTLIEGAYMGDEEQNISWNGRNDNGTVVANGVYFYVIESSVGERAVGKAAVLR